MTKDEALKLALEALEYPGPSWIEARQPAVTAIKAALEAKDEPVAWRTFDGEGGYEYRTYENNEDYADEWGKRNPKHKGWVQPLYTTPPQRTWIGLTDEEMEAAIPFGNLSGEYSYDDILNIILLIQAKLRSKNYD
jgi:hypothetical protein